jgi:hypothetical protein
MELCKDLLDELNGRGRSAPTTDFNRTTVSMHFYSSVAVFEKGRHLEKKSLMTPTKRRTTIAAGPTSGSGAFTA